MDKSTESSAETKAIPPMTEWSDRQLSKWQETGDVPGQSKEETPADGETTSKADTPAEAAAAEPAEQAASTDATSKAASEPAAPEKSKKSGKKTARERAAEITAEAAEEERLVAEALERRRRAREARREAEREEPTAKKAEHGADAAAAAEVPAWKKYQGMPGAPKSSDFESLDDFAAAMGHFVAEKLAREAASSIFDERSKTERESQRVVSEWQERASAGMQKASAELEADPQIMERIDPRFHTLTPLHETPPAQRSVAHFVKDRALSHSEHPLQVLAWLSENDCANLKRISSMGQDGIIAAIARQDAKFDVDDPDADDAQEATDVRQSKRVSNAPPPSPTLGKKPSPGRDPLKPPDSYADFDAWNETTSKAERGRRG